MNETKSIELNIPYPPAKSDGVNIYFASLLTNDFAGPVSEFSAVTGYTFQLLVTPDQKIAPLLSGISRTEMHHLQLIGQLIVSLGGSPRYAVQNGCGTSFWNGQVISYNTDPKNYLRKNITDERITIDNYRSRIEQITDSGVRAVLKRIIEDEEHHIDLFGQALAEIE